MSTPHKSGTSYFTRVPYDLNEALRNGDITPLMFLILEIFYRLADWDTGVVENVSAELILDWMGAGSDGADDLPSARTVRRHMQGAQETGRFLSDYRKGQKRPHSVTLTNFHPRRDADRDGDCNGDREEIVLNPHELKSWRETSVFQGREENRQKTVTKTVRRPGEDQVKATKDIGSVGSVGSLGSDLALVGGKEGRLDGEPAAPAAEPTSNSKASGQGTTGPVLPDLKWLLEQMSAVYQSRTGHHLHASKDQRNRLQEYVLKIKPLGSRDWQSPAAQVAELFGRWVTSHPSLKNINSIIDVFISQADQESLADYIEEHEELEAIAAGVQP